MHYLRLHFLLHALQSAKTEQIDVELSLYINVKTYRKPLMIMRSRDVVVPYPAPRLICGVGLKGVTGNEETGN